MKPVARRVREHVIRMITAAGSGHPGGSLSAAEILTILFFHTLSRRPGDPTWPERDRFVISKGHGVPIVYAALAEAEALSKTGIPVRRHGVHDFGESGSAEALSRPSNGSMRRVSPWWPANIWPTWEPPAGASG